MEGSKEAQGTKEGFLAPKRLKCVPVGDILWRMRGCGEIMEFNPR